MSNTTITADSHHHDIHVAHGILMLMAWAVLIPCSVACSMLLRRDDSLLFFRVHYILAGLGVLLAIIAWILVAHSSSTHQAHPIMGTCVMSITIAIILLYPVMGKPSLPRNPKQQIVVLLHKGLGSLLFVMAVVTFVLGIWRKANAVIWYGGLGAACLITLGVTGVLRQKQTQQQPASVGETQSLLPRNSA
ncbi:expressed unknown protein [Seminavis robusta]|uniref:Cytochrome b561 domain-containing protein n=1 Tax=Seminavis robusta TaxID=568900 RepID=A0A9N8DVH1_9STRA|nr:expressed unknown protein [Seminavis robusta]|eukprot:Sro276_g105900.1 n/a (191) ;mRNA; f:9365-9937